jgi:hypothetical protein
MRSHESSDSHARPMSLSAFAKLWHCDAEFQADGDSKHWVVIWEPLDVTAPPDARPHVYGMGEISFYDRTGNALIVRRARYHDLNDTFPNLLLMSDGIWRESMPGEIVYRDGRWWHRFRGADNTRAARMMNAGWGEYLAFAAPPVTGAGAAGIVAGGAAKGGGE